MQRRDDVRLREFAEFFGQTEIAGAFALGVQQAMAREGMQQRERRGHVEVEILAQGGGIHARLSRRQGVDTRDNALDAAAQVRGLEAEIVLVGDQRAGLHGVPPRGAGR